MVSFNGTVSNLTLLTLTVQEMISFHHITVLEARILNWNKWWCTLFYNSSLFFSDWCLSSFVWYFLANFFFVSILPNKMSWPRICQKNSIKYKSYFCKSTLSKGVNMHQSRWLNYIISTHLTPNKHKLGVHFCKPWFYLSV